MSEAARRDRDHMSPDKMDEVARRVREYGFDDVADWIEEGAEDLREGEVE